MVDDPAHPPVNRLESVSDNRAIIGQYVWNGSFYERSRGIPQEYNARTRSRKEDIINWVMGYGPENLNEYSSFDPRFKTEPKQQIINPGESSALSGRAERAKEQQQEALKSEWGGTVTPAMQANVGDRMPDDLSRPRSDAEQKQRQEYISKSSSENPNAPAWASVKMFEDAVKDTRGLRSAPESVFVVQPAQQTAISNEPKPSGYELKLGDFGYHATSGNIGGLGYSPYITIEGTTVYQKNTNSRLPENKYDPKYGLMVREDLAPNADVFNVPEFKPMSKGTKTEDMFTYPIYIGANVLKEKLYGFAETIEPNGSKTGSVLRNVSPYLIRSAGNVVEFGGMVPVGTERLIRNPSYIIPAVGAGITMQVGGIAEQAQKNPAQLASDVVVFTGAFKASGYFTNKVIENIRFAGKTYIPPESIIEPDILSGKKEFPTALRGTTANEMVKEFKTSKFKLPGTEEKLGGWHATPETFPSETKTLAGMNRPSDTAGLYIAPSTSAHFWGIGKGFKLFGFDNPPNRPAGLWIETQDITRTPPNTRMNIEVQRQYLLKSAPKGTAYITSAFEKGIKLEKEATITPETQMERVNNQFYTKWEGKKVPLMEYKALNTDAEILSDVKLNKKIGTELIGDAYRYSTALQNINKKDIFGGSVGVTAGRLSQQQQKASEEYRNYKTPIFSEKSIVGSLRVSEIATKNIESSIKSTAKSSSKSLLSSDINPSISASISRVIKSSVGSISPYTNRPEYISYPKSTSYPEKIVYPSEPDYFKYSSKPYYSKTPKYTEYSFSPGYPNRPLLYSSPNNELKNLKKGYKRFTKDLFTWRVKNRMLELRDL